MSEHGASRRSARDFSSAAWPSSRPSRAGANIRPAPAPTPVTRPQDVQINAVPQRYLRLESAWGAKARVSPRTKAARRPLHPKGGKANEHATRSDISRIAEVGDGSAARELRVYVAAQPGFLKTRRACGDRREDRLADLQQGSPHGDDAKQGRRVPSFRLECVFLILVAAHWSCVPRATIPDHPRAPFLADIHRGHQARSYQGHDSQDHRA